MVMDKKKIFRVYRKKFISFFKFANIREFGKILQRMKNMASTRFWGAIKIYFSSKVIFFNLILRIFEKNLYYENRGLFSQSIPKVFKMS